MAINYAPKVGEILECDFGTFQLDENNKNKMNNFNGRIPPEIVKKRMVVILNGKLNQGCLVVPISSSENSNFIQRGLHISLPHNLFRVTDFYDQRERWAKADLIQMVSRERLYKLKDKRYRFDQHLPREEVTKIQRAVIKAISANSLMNNIQ
ncbi:type II toxin-antitoxin system PemK/MazF family toxin [Shewanella surugensis]|uniref:Type II toxin-antitoxin system PemK/MazF family toxin n=1 Tax=Shewanella surugensis TaxID=212020 RepID=A0ABT0LJT4_9GAMM|nr:type II toxin-antitoxin system PemK/MazF family toxin [Shewanella surugensis]MCL1127969.1 type II toxin-antitoxin system PemK/MazF family toxin [Shewanella surugensis]